MRDIDFKAFAHIEFPPLARGMFKGEYHSSTYEMSLRYIVMNQRQKRIKGKQ